MKPHHYITAIFGLIIAGAILWTALNDDAGRVFVVPTADGYVQASELDKAAGLASVSYDRTIGLWVSAMFTLFIFSFLYEDNPLYKIAESVVVGVSAAYWMVVGFWDVVIPNLLGKLSPAWVQSWASPGLTPVRDEGWFWNIVPLILGGMLLMRLFPKGNWIARWPLAFIIGTTAGIRLIGFIEADFISQITSGMKPLIAVDLQGNFDLSTSLKHIALVLSTLACLVYFFFSVEHKGVVGGVARYGIWVLMITFGAAFGMTVMGRIALLAARFEFLFKDWLGIVT